MPRQTSNNSSSQRNYSRTTPTIYEKKISSTQTPLVPPSYQTTPGIMSSIKQGIGLGMGSEIGHRVVNSFLGASSSPQYTSAGEHLPTEYRNLYAQCIEKNTDFPEICKPFLTKDKSSWKQCMEEKKFNHLDCIQ